MDILKNRAHSRSLERLHNKYVLVPANKAAQNVINPRRACTARVGLCVCVCYSPSHFSSVRSCHEGYQLLNGQQNVRTIFSETAPLQS